MSNSSLDSLPLGLPHEQYVLQNPLACFALGYSALETAGMENRAEVSFAPEAFGIVPFMRSRRLQLESTADLNTFSASQGAEAIRYSGSSDTTQHLHQATNDNALYFLANNAKFSHLQNLQQPHIVCNPYQPQGYYFHGVIQPIDHRHFPTNGWYNYSPVAPVTDSPSPCSTSPTLGHSPPLGWPSPDMINGDQPRSGSPNLPRCDEDDDDSLCDKPYARLIYDALMQAPGHRMMLREIYEWFQSNTTKPRESGTSGWQNSIRHNLSMNQVGINRGLWFGMCWYNLTGLWKRQILPFQPWRSRAEI